MDKPRKVIYRLQTELTGYIPDMTNDEKQEIGQQHQEKNGWFHGWTEESELDPHTGNYLIQKKALIEQLNGKIIALPYSHITFIAQSK